MNYCKPCLMSGLCMFMELLSSLTRNEFIENFVFGGPCDLPYLDQLEGA